MSPVLFLDEKSDDAQVLRAGINIQLDSETVAKTLGNVQLAAVMGFTKIQIPKAFQVSNLIHNLIKFSTLSHINPQELFEGIMLLPKFNRWRCVCLLPLAKECLANFLSQTQAISAPMSN